jgi:2-polyprenyl-3-methyl-5-hydroxy-6-metoxy-1,4-benzoquinol methylase
MNYIWDINNKKTYNNRMGFYKFNRQLDFINKYVENSYSCLDIAGGSGRFAIPLKNKINRIVVIDINIEALTVLKDRNSEIETICKDFIDLNLDEKFDFIICIEAINYFEKQNEFFLKIENLLTVDGHFIFTFTNINSWRYYLRKLRHRKRKNLMYNEYPLNQLKKIIELNNLKIVEIKGMNWIPFPLSSNSIFVPFFAWIENVLCLNRWIAQSPWLLISVRKDNK